MYCAILFCKLIYHHTHRKGDIPRHVFQERCDVESSGTMKVSFESYQGWKQVADDCMNQLALILAQENCNHLLQYTI